MSDLKTFGRALAVQELREVDLAVALVWFLGRQQGHDVEVSAVEIVDTLAALRLRTTVNLTRLKQNLAKHPDLVRGRSPGTFKIKAGREERLEGLYGDWVEAPPLKVKDSVIPNDIPLGSRPLLHDLRRQANGCFDLGFFDASAVMCRRLVELLLIDAFEKSGHLDAITDGKRELKAFGDIIAAAKSKQYVRLSRGAPAALDRVKHSGDAGAHNRFYPTRQRDIEELNPGLRHLVAELAEHAGLT